MNAFALLMLFVGIAIGFAVAFFLALLSYRQAQMNLQEAELYSQLVREENNAGLGGRRDSEEAEGKPAE